jgi:hypothetical protein
VPTVRVGFFPLSEQLDGVAEHLTQDVARQAVWLAGQVPYQQAEAILAEIGQVTIPATSIWRRVQHSGSQFAALEEAERVRATALPEKWEPPSRAEQADQRMGVSLDGFMVHLRAEGWKEMKLGAVFALALRPARDVRTGEVAPAAHAVNLSYAAHLGGPEVFGALLFSEAKRRGWEQAQDTQVIGDGSVWICSNSRFEPNSLSQVGPYPMTRLPWVRNSGLSRLTVAILLPKRLYLELLLDLEPSRHPFRPEPAISGLVSRQAAPGRGSPVVQR